MKGADSLNRLSQWRGGLSQLHCYPRIMSHAETDVQVCKGQQRRNKGAKEMKEEVKVCS